MSNLARRVPIASAARRFAFAITLLGALAYEAVKDAVRGNPKPDHFRFTQRDVNEDMPLSVERYRWTQGGIA